MKRHEPLPPLTDQEVGAPRDDGQVLRKLRNTHGPTWLDRYRLPKRPLDPKKLLAEDP